MLAGVPEFLGKGRLPEEEAGGEASLPPGTHTHTLSQMYLEKQLCF